MAGVQRTGGPARAAWGGDHDAPATPRAREGVRILEKAARTAGTGLLFAVFGLGGLLLACVLVPLRAVMGGGPRDLAAQRLIHRGHALYVRFGELLRLWSVEVEHAEFLQGPGGRLIVANHPSLIDVVLLLARLPQADCVVKREAWRNPFLAPVVRAAGYLPNDPGEALVEHCAERLRSGRIVILFPEGSRSPAGGLRPFHRGAAHVLLQSGVPLVPVAIRCDPPALKKGQPWWALPNQKLRFRLSVGEPRTLESFGLDGLARPAAARRITHALEAYFLAKAPG